MRLPRRREIFSVYQIRKSKRTQRVGKSRKFKSNLLFALVQVPERRALFTVLPANPRICSRCHCTLFYINGLCGIFDNKRLRARENVTCDFLHLTHPFSRSHDPTHAHHQHTYQTLALSLQRSRLAFLRPHRFYVTLPYLCGP